MTKTSSCGCEFLVRSQGKHRRRRDQFLYLADITVFSGRGWRKAIKAATREARKGSPAEVRVVCDGGSIGLVRCERSGRVRKNVRCYPIDSPRSNQARIAGKRR